MKFNDYQYIVAYGMAIMLFMLAIKSRFGYVTVYYALCLFAFALTLINSNSLVSMLQPAIDTSSSSSSTPNTTSG